MAADGENTVWMTGVLMAREALRWTPGKVAVLEFKLEHTSRQIEAGAERDVSCELVIRAVGPVAQQIAVVALGSVMKIDGFLGAKSSKNRNPVLHVRTFELLEGI
jgi:primosomal replication protein N